MQTGSRLRGRPRSGPVLAEHGLAIARAGWLLFAAGALILLLLAIPGLAVRKPMGSLGGHLVWKPTSFMLIIHRLNLAGTFMVILSSYTLAALLFSRRKQDLMALFTAYYLLLHGLLFGGVVELLEPMWPEAAAFNSFILLPVVFAPLTMLMLAIFPSGTFVPRWTRWPVIGSVLLAMGLAPLNSLYLLKAPNKELTPLMVMLYSAGGLIVLSLVGAQFHRYRHVSTRHQRQQTKWVLYGFLLMLCIFVVASIPWTIALTLAQGTIMPWWIPPAESLWLLAMAIFPLTITTSIMRYRLYEIDLLINRTLVYGGLTTVVVGLYVLVVGALSVLLQARNNLIIALVATGLIAVLFQPLRQRLQRGANRLIYGERDDPFEALTRLGRRLENVFSPEMVYPTIVETVAQALKLPYVALAVRKGNSFVIARQTGRAVHSTATYPLIHQGEEIGRLVVGQRGNEERFTRADERLLRSFARQAGAAVRAVRLTADLQQSRYELVTTREEERLRLRRDLHDGLGPTLASVVWQAESARDLIAADPAEAARMLEANITQAQSALADIRRLVYGLRPPALDELGLVGALEQAAGQYQPTDAKIKAPLSLPTLPAAIEVAAYRIVQEALKNAVEHGKAANCIIRISFDGKLHLSIEDDGVGLQQPVRSGVGLISMRQRAEELGGEFDLRQGKTGGTVVRVTLPVE